MRIKANSLNLENSQTNLHKLPKIPSLVPYAKYLNIVKHFDSNAIKIYPKYNKIGIENFFEIKIEASHNFE